MARSPGFPVSRSYVFVSTARFPSRDRSRAELRPPTGVSDLPGEAHPWLGTA
jgi:hypothetical protein